MYSYLRKSLASKIALVFFCVASFSLTGCLDKDVEIPEPTPTTYFSFYHGSPDAPDFDIHLDNKLLNGQPFKYSSFSGYVAFTPGSYSIKFSPVNAVNAYVDSTITFEDKKVYSIFAINKLDDLELLVVEDPSTGPTTDKAVLRVVHLSPDAPALDISTTGTAESMLTTDLEFKNVTSFMPLDGGKYNLDIKAADTGETLVSVTNTTFQAGATYTLIVRGFETPPTGNANALHAQVIRNL